ncbi:IS110 family transposase [Bradyrhizobium liaoningense]|uniref:IS110 family transposase n=1 Tax=Bradyrhizobium liaoningense TaxID=43992 RepID=UPI001BA63BD2|nr:IS110 family transposase [Bradyrhizobium liaoningense]MBR0823158.1 IS110 family transposase [Bradyrhizobium liaoningense]
MKLYVGLDVGLEETSVCIVDSEGLTVREIKVSTEPEAIRSAVEGYADRLDRVGVEASSLGIWLYRELQSVGLPIIVVEARHMRVSLSTMRNKTDRNDARGIAQMMRLGWYRAVHVKNIDMQKMRTLLTNRKLLKRKLIDLENHVRGALRAYGLLVGAVARGSFEARVRELIEHSDPIFVMSIQVMLDVRRALREGYDRLHRVLLQVVQHDPVCRRLMTVPGVGPVVALSFKVGVDDPHRCARSRTVGAHFGLTPKRHQSGTSIDFEGRISKQGDISVREALCEAAASLLLRVRKWSALRAWGLRIAKRSSMLCAIAAVARKLAGILHRMWVSETDFHVGFGAKVTQRLRLKPAQ